MKTAKSRKGDDAPLEISSKIKPRPFHKMQQKKPIRTDPRFDPRVKGCAFIDDYEFVEKIRDKEIGKMKTRLKRKISDNEKKKLEWTLKRMRQKKATIDDFRVKKRVMEKIRTEQDDALDDGKMPQFYSKSQIKEKIKEERSRAKKQKLKRKTKTN